MRYALVIPLLFIAVVANAQSPAERIAPYLTDGSIAVGRLDLDAVNVEATFENVKRFLPIDPSQHGEVLAELKKMAATIKATGATEAFAVVDLEDVPNRGVFIVVPLSEEADRKAIRGLLQPAGFETIEEIDGALVAGSKRAVERVKANGKPSERANLEEAFAGAGERPIQVVLVPSADHRRVLREMLPDLPAEYGGATGAQLAAGLQWASLGIALEPKLAATLVVQSESEQAAEALKTAMTQGLRELSKKPEVVKTVPILPMLVGSLTPKREGDRLVLVIDETLESAAKALGAVTAGARGKAWENQSVNNLKQIGLAMHNFHDNYGSFPPSASYDASGKPLLSWRVYLLPYLGQQPLYDQFHLDEPWDSEHNKKLIEQMPEVFNSPLADAQPGHTVYLAPVGNGTVFEGKTGTPIPEIKDGVSNTILVLEATAEKAVPWTKPGDPTINREDPLAGLIGDRERFPVLLCDGAVLRLPATIDAKSREAILTIHGREVVDWSEINR
ncbi:MAG: DUF1559 domain-containing protein [Planctomycetaceae bacterium]